MCHNCAYLNAPNFLLLMFLNLPQHHLCLFNSWFHTSLVQNHLHFHTGVAENKIWHQKLGLRTPSLGDSEICITATEIATPFGNKISNLGLGNVFAQFFQTKNSFSSKIHEYILNWFPEYTEQGQQCSGPSKPHGSWFSSLKMKSTRERPQGDRTCSGYFLLCEPKALVSF